MTDPLRSTLRFKKREERKTIDLDCSSCNTTGHLETYPSYSLDAYSLEQAHFEFSLDCRGSSHPYQRLFLQIGIYCYSPTSDLVFF